jgi:hypothetical protein
MTVAVGTSCRSSSNLFALNSVLDGAIAVMLPPGLLKLATRPYLTGSVVTATIGIVLVADLAARAETLPPTETITAT